MKYDGLQSKRVLVTGAGGFIGSHLVEELSRSGARVKAFVHYNSRNDWGMLEFLPKDALKEIEVVAGDICDPFSVREAIGGCEVVFHLAALIGIPYSYRAPQSYIAVNVQGTLNVLQASLDEGIELMFRYYNPDGSLFWEGKYKQWPGCFDDSPGSFSGMISCGWEQPGNWPVGTYTVKVWMEGNFLGQGSFKIYEDRDPIDIGKKVAMSGELKQTKKGEPYWIKRSSSSSATHSFRVMFYVNKNWVIFFEMPKSKSGELIMWVKDRSSNPYKKRVSTSDNKKKSYGPVTKSEFEQAAWRILKYFDY